MPKFMNATKVITGVNTRWSYANVWDPKSINGGAPKYSVSLIIPKSDTATVNKIKAAIQAAYEEGQSKLKGNGKSVPALSAIKTLCATAIWNAPMMKPTRTATSSTPTVLLLPVSRCGQAADPGALGSVLRRIWQSQHQPLRFQQQRQ